MTSVSDGAGYPKPSRISSYGLVADRTRGRAFRHHVGRVIFQPVVWLMMNMPQYRHVFLTDLEWMVLPPIKLNQYRLFRAGNHIVAFAAWAYLSEAAEARLQEPNPRLAPADWKSGDRLWLIDLHAPFGQQELALKELRETALKGKTFKMHRWTPQGRQIVEIVPEGNSPAPA